jgi:hypothetical protein
LLFIQKTTGDTRVSFRGLLWPCMVSKGRTSPFSRLNTTTSFFEQLSEDSRSRPEELREQRSIMEDESIEAASEQGVAPSKRRPTMATERTSSTLPIWTVSKPMVERRGRVCCGTAREGLGSKRWTIGREGFKAWIPPPLLAGQSPRWVGDTTNSYPCSRAHSRMGS